MSPSGLSDLRQLSNIIGNAVDRIEQTLTARSVEFPSLDTPYDEAEEQVRAMPEIADATVAIIASAEQLAMVARAPSLTMLDISFKFHLCAALRVALEADVAEFLREHGPSNVQTVAKQKDLDPSKLARILRMLATNHIFIEVSPDVFTNNRLSSTLDSGCSCEQLAADPSAKLVRFPAIVSFMLDSSFKGGAYLADVLLDPATSHSTSPNDAAFCKAYNYDGPMWDLIELPGNERQRERFGAAMLGITALAHPDSILEVLDWASLPAGSVVVDVGGGVGTQMILLARKFDDLKLVVQEREAVCIDASKYVMEELPSGVQTGRLQIQAHDFFEPQPVKDAAVFYVRHVCHDWPDALAVKILQRLREAAQPNTKLILHDSIMQHACAEERNDDIGNSLPAVPPEPLLANWGRANSEMYNMDMQMMAVYHAQERTLTQFRSLLMQSGWKVAKVNYGSRPMAIANHSIIAVPDISG
ncbi:S-adenosyl-L-methionine-dependent methyltransferase [Peniophora sp. CONT]|nr:S-adenosyl-L-methionine-dependent methyltransferase [Peniophora sp. CONT]